MVPNEFYSPVHTLWRTVGLNEKKWTVGVCVSLQWSSPFFAKSLLHFWDTLQGNRAILGYLRCLKSRGMIKVVVVGGGEVVPAPGNLAWLWEEGRQTRNDFQLLVLYLSSSPTSPTTKVFLFPTPKAQLGFQETEKQHFVPDSAWSGQRSDVRVDGHWHPKAS